MNVKSSLDVFTTKASLYAKYRLGYADAAVAEVIRRTRITPDSVVADVGSGTGILTRRFLDHARLVYAVEPNAGMRSEAEAALSAHPAFRSIAGAAEATTLPDHAVDLIIVGQALHWFDPVNARQEFERISAPDAWLAIFSYHLPAHYLKTIGKHLAAVPDLAEGFGVVPKGTPADYLGSDAITLSFASVCRETWEQFFGGALSMASAPEPDDPRFPDYEAAHRRAFAELAVDGIIHLNYTTRVVLGRLES